MMVQYLSHRKYFVVKKNSLSNITNTCHLFLIQCHLELVDSWNPSTLFSSLFYNHLGIARKYDVRVFLTYCYNLRTHSQSTYLVTTSLSRHYLYSPITTLPFSFPAHSFSLLFYKVPYLIGVSSVCVASVRRYR